MQKPEKKSTYKVDWVLVNELAIGPAPRKERHLNMIKDLGIKSILSLCDEEEAKPPKGMKELFNCKRIVLPDHRVKRLVEASEIKEAISILKSLQNKKPVFVHCVAAMERSPLVCLAWLRINKGLTQMQALQYLMSVHRGTSPTAEQLKVLETVFH